MHAIAGQLRSSLHMLSGELVTMVNSLGFLEALRRADRDHDLRAFLMLEALKGMSLDPLAGTTPGAFYSTHGAVTTFAIQFHGWVNFIGGIELPAGSARARQLMDAIEANLSSKMFKAARMHRRLTRRKQRLLNQAYARANKAYSHVRDQCSGRLATMEDEERANQAFRNVFDPRNALLNERVHRVATASAPGFVGAYSEAVAKFLYWHLPIH